MDKFLSAHEVVELTGLSRSTIYALFHSDGFPATRVGRRWLVSEAALRDWLARGGSAQRREVPAR